MRWHVLAALILIAGVNQTALARQDQRLASQADATTPQQDFYRVNGDQNSRSDPQQRMRFRKRYDRILDRNPKEIISDICIGC